MSSPKTANKNMLNAVRQQFIQSQSIQKSDKIKALKSLLKYNKSISSIQKLGKNDQANNL